MSQIQIFSIFWRQFNSNNNEFKNSGGETPLQGSHYFWEVFVNDELKHSVINKTPRIFENVKGEMANGLPHSAKGVYKNLSFKTTESAELKLDKLFDKIDEIFDKFLTSKSKKIQNIHYKWKSMSTKFSDKYVKLQKFCQFPSTWKDFDFEKAVDGYDRDNACEAIDQTVKDFEKWAYTFTADCRKLDDGTELDWADKQMIKVEALGERTKRKLQCRLIGK